MNPKSCKCSETWDSAMTYLSWLCVLGEIWWTFLSVLKSNTNCDNHVIISGDIFSPSWHRRGQTPPMNAACGSRLSVVDYSNATHYELCYMNTQSVLITLTQATLVHISRQSDSVVLNWWLVAQQGRRPWVRWHGTALHRRQARIFLVVKAQWGDGWLR